MFRSLPFIPRRQTEATIEGDKLDTLVHNGTKHLFEIKTVWPFDFFPDRLVIDPLKISYVHREFFFEEETKCILIENMGHILVSSGPIFSTLTIVDIIFSPNTILMKPVFKQEAIKAQNILHGLLVSKREHIDTTKVSTLDGISALEQLGRSS